MSHRPWALSASGLPVLFCSAEADVITVWAHRSDSCSISSPASDQIKDPFVLWGQYTQEQRVWRRFSQLNHTDLFLKRMSGCCIHRNTFSSFLLSMYALNLHFMRYTRLHALVYIFLLVINTEMLENHNARFILANKWSTSSKCNESSKNKHVKRLLLLEHMHKDAN